MATHSLVKQPTNSTTMTAVPAASANTNEGDRRRPRLRQAHTFKSCKGVCGKRKTKIELSAGFVSASLLSSNPSRRLMSARGLARESASKPQKDHCCAVRLTHCLSGIPAG